jgi:transposase-like protein
VDAVFADFVARRQAKGTGYATEQFKQNAVAQITESGFPIRLVYERPGANWHALYAWKRKFGKRKHARSRILSPVEFERWRKTRHAGGQETRGYSNASCS